MPNHDYVCGCGYVFYDVYRPVSEGAQANPPYCPVCGLRMGWLPAIGRIDLLPESAKFVQYDGQNRPVTVDSFAAMHKLEQESEQQARNGEGQPIRFRALHQSKSQMDVNTFGEGPAEKPSEEAKRKFGLGAGAKRISGDEAGAREYGPGVSDANTSALKD